MWRTRTMIHMPFQPCKSPLHNALLWTTPRAFYFRSLGLVLCRCRVLISLIPPCGLSNVFSASRVRLGIPWLLINQGNGQPTPAAAGDTYRGNLFRVVAAQPMGDTQSCTPATCAYGSYSPTGDNPPNFHVTPAFTTFTLV